MQKKNLKGREEAVMTLKDGQFKKEKKKERKDGGKKKTGRKREEKNSRKRKRETTEHRLWHSAHSQHVKSSTKLPLPSRTLER